METAKSEDKEHEREDEIRLTAEPNAEGKETGARSSSSTKLLHQQKGEVSGDIKENKGIIGAIINVEHMHFSQDIAPSPQSSDITIKASDREIRARRNILSNISPHFRAMFDSGEYTSTVDLSNLNGNILDKILSMAKIDIQWEDVFDILSIASFLVMDSLVSDCCMYLVNHMNLENCFDILNAAEKHGCSDLYEKAKIGVLHNFVDTCKGDRFCQLPPELVLKLIKDENIVVAKQNRVLTPREQELEIWNVIESYVQYDLPNRKQWLPRFLDYIRLPLIGPRYLKNIEASTLIRGDGACSKIVEKAKLSSGSTDSTNNRWTTPRNFAEHRYFTTPLVGRYLEQPLETFDDSEIVFKDRAHVKGMTFYIRHWNEIIIFGGIRVVYSNGCEKFHGKDFDCVKKQEFSLQNNELITEVKIKSGWMIDSLKFYTNLGNTFGPFGGDGGDEHIISPPRHFPYLACISGMWDEGISNLRFHYGYYQFSKPLALLKHRQPDLLVTQTLPPYYSPNGDFLLFCPINT